ncbi:MAG: glycoside hydrolase family 97 N-terminal domain-containing protein [Arcicella sp.]|nr:glycoside hydrolase family 97 N-terminal domain-containing protein [Arcicella sp.]
METCITEVSSIRNNYRELKIKIKDKNNTKNLLNIIFRVFDDGVGFRYEFTQESALELQLAKGGGCAVSFIKLREKEF